jgi:hypothetical protein
MNPAAAISSTATNIPQRRPVSPGPMHSDFIRQQVAKQSSNNYHSSSLKMITQSVNRTALHPGGVQYVACLLLSLSSHWPFDRPGKSHTELEEELHETAHIDYDRVAIVWQPSNWLTLVLTNWPFSGCQPLRCCPLRRCPRLRNRYCHHIERCAHCILWCKNWPFPVRQACCPRIDVRERYLVGTRQQTHDPWGMFWK